LSYSASLLFELAFAVLFLSGMRLDTRGLLFFSGSALGLAFFARPFDGLLFAVPFGVFMLSRMRGDAGRQVRQAVWVGLGFLPMLGLLMAYNAYVTGSPLAFPYSLWRSEDRLGFGLKRISDLAIPIDYNPVTAFRALLGNLKLLSLWSFGGPVLVGPRC
jgi:hypothetical protein